MTWERNIAGLTSYKPTWKHGTTKTIRVPIVLAEAVLEYARTLDNGDAIGSSPNNRDEAIADIIAKVNQKLPGYRANSASQLIKDLKAVPNGVPS